MRRIAVLVCAVAVLGAGAAKGVPSPRLSEPIEQTDAALAFDGTNYFVLWDQVDLNLKTFGTFGARVHPDGTVVDPDGLPIRDGLSAPA